MSLRVDIFGNTGDAAWSDEDQLAYLRANAGIFTQYGRRCRMLLKSVEASL